MSAAHAAAAVAVTVVLVAPWTQAAAMEFENGFSGGMSIDAVRKIVSSRGTTLTDTDPSRDRTTPEARRFASYSAVGKPGDFGLGDSFSFCDGRLDLYSTSVPGGFPAFTRVLESRTSKLGPPSVGSKIDETSFGPVYNLSLFWHREQGPETLTLYQIEGQTASVNRTFRENLPGCPKAAY